MCSLRARRALRRRFLDGFAVEVGPVSGLYRRRGSGERVLAVLLNDESPCFCVGEHGVEFAGGRPSAVH